MKNLEKKQNNGIGTITSDSRAYPDQGRESSSYHLSYRKGVVRNRSPGFQASVSNVLKWSKIELIQVKHQQKAREKHESRIEALKEPILKLSSEPINKGHPKEF